MMTHTDERYWQQAKAPENSIKRIDLFTLVILNWLLYMPTGPPLFLGPQSLGRSFVLVAVLVVEWARLVTQACRKESTGLHAF